jgi:DNA-binding MarR family transcriptional regulator
MNSGGRRPPVELMAILHAAHAAEAEVESKLNGVGLSLAKLLALKVLVDAGDPLPLGQLAERLSCVKSNITQLVDRLEVDGLVARLPDPKDRRARLAALTVAGRQACEQGERVRQETEATLLGRLTHDEAHLLESLLSKVGNGGV